MRSVCKGEQTEEHDWDKGTVTKEPTEWEDGIKTFTCTGCSTTKTEPIDKLVHECVWTDWYPNVDENHKRDCMDDHCDRYETLPHEWDNGVITTEPTEEQKGVKTFTCQTCQHTRTEDIPALSESAWSILDVLALNVAIQSGEVNTNPSAYVEYDRDKNGLCDTNDLIALILEIVG